MFDNNEFKKYATKHMGLNSMHVEHYIESSLTPYIIEERQLNMSQMDVFSRLMMDRIIFLGTGINDNVANIVNAQLLFLESADSKKDIQIYLNSPGGSVYAGLGAGINTLYGLDNVSDIRIAFEYGATDKLMVGFGRSRGTGFPYRSLLDGFVKYRLLHQDKKGMPLSLSLLGTSTYTYMPASTNLGEVNAFPRSIYRFAYCSQINIARKFGNKFSLSIIPTLVYRNYVATDDVNALFSIGSAVSYAVNSKVSLIVEYYSNIQKETVRSNYQNSLSAAIEWITFGHNFKVYLTNAGGFGETQFIPYTNTDWAKGQFRLGFCISRKYMKE